jgi:hypothetical protein
MRPGGRLLLALALAGCQPPPPPATTTRTVTDSAGIEIVRVDFGETAPPFALLDTTRVVDIGVAEGSATLELSGVVGAVRLSDGRIVIANGGTDELRFFDAAGNHVQTVGRDGEGPGEFRAISFIGRLPGDTLLIYDTRLRRVSLFDGSGKFNAAHSLTGAVLPYVAGVPGPRTLAGWQWVGEEPDKPGVYAAAVEFGTFDLADARFRAAGIFPGSEQSVVQYRGRAMPGFRPFGRSGDVAAAAGHIFTLASYDDAGIRVHDAAGRLIRIIRVPLQTPSPDAPAQAAWEDSWIARFSSGNAELEAWWRHGFRETPPPARIPVFRSLEADTNGNVCAERYPLTWVSPLVYWCFSPAGEWLRAFELPAGMLRQGPHPHHDAQLEIGPDHVLGVWQDEAGVQHVRLYSVGRAASPQSR